MAISSTAVWEVRTTGASTNGGAFVTGASGSDFSQQPGPQFALTGVTSAGAGSTVLHASAAASMVGNVAQVISGTNFTTGFFEIISVVAGVSITFNTNFAGVAITTGVGATGVINVGGAFKYSATAVDGLFASSVRPGNIVWVKSGTYTATGFNYIAATVNLPIKYLGYNVTRGDNPLSSTRPVLDMNTDQFLPGAFWTIKNVIFKSGNTIRTFTGGAQGVTSYCKFINTAALSNSATAGVAAGESLFFMCEFISIGNAFGASSRQVFDHCYFHDSDIGMTFNTGSFGITVANCIFEGCVTKCIDFQTAATTRHHIMNTTFYGSENQLGIGISAITGLGCLSVVNNIFYGLATAINVADPIQNYFADYNDFYNNGTDVVNWTKASTDIALNPQFVNVTQLTGTTATTASSVLTDSGQNFSNVVDNQTYCYLKSGTGITAGQYLITSHTTTTITLSPAPGNNATANKVYQITLGHNFAIGTNLKAAGQGGFPAALSTGYNDMGAVQRPELYPATTDVRTGVTYATTLTGTCAVPIAASVLTGVAVDATVGTLALLTGPTAAQNAAAVWDEATSGHTTAGTFGVLIKQLLTLAQFLGLK